MKQSMPLTEKELEMISHQLIAQGLMPSLESSVEMLNNLRGKWQSVLTQHLEKRNMEEKWEEEDDQ